MNKTFYFSEKKSVGNAGSSVELTSRKEALAVTVPSKSASTGENESSPLAQNDKDRQTGAAQASVDRKEVFVVESQSCRHTHSVTRHHSHDHDHRVDYELESGHNHSHHEHHCCDGEDSLVDVHAHASDMVSDSNTRKALVKACVMEVSVAIHSVIIGFDFGALTSDSVEDELSALKVLMIAFAFHQFFEGISLGTAIFQVKQFSTITKLIFGFMFSLTTPIGIVIGLSSVETSDGVLVAGIAASLAAGSLMYTGLIEMIAEDFSDPMLLVKPFLKVQMFASLCVGATFMAILAIWG
jgi:zinc transporter ZupT